jgi:small conductance mechanosensitive channel
MDSQLQSLEQVKVSVLDMLVKFGPKRVVAVVILAAGYMVGRWAGGVLDRMLAHLQLEAPVRSLLVRMGRLVVLALFSTTLGHLDRSKVIPFPQREVRMLAA